MTVRQAGGTKRPGAAHKSREQYRRLLKRPRLPDKKIEAMRKYVILLAQTICEHVWGKRFY
jgi:hypothetical protein